MHADLLPRRWQTLACSPRRGPLSLGSNIEREGWAVASMPPRVFIAANRFKVSSLLADAGMLTAYNCAAARCEGKRQSMS